MVHVPGVRSEKAIALKRSRRHREERSEFREGIGAAGLSLAGLAIVIAMIILVQHVSFKPQTTHASIPPSEKSGLPLPSIPSIVVLPFTNLSGDPQQEYFSDGITDELITKLSRLKHLLVIARTSTLPTKTSRQRCRISAASWGEVPARGKRAKIQYPGAHRDSACRSAHWH